METAIQKTKIWLESFVIGLNLCPFAKFPYDQNRVRYRVDSSMQIEHLHQSILEEFHFLMENDAETVETTLIIYPNVLGDFQAYLDFLGFAQDLLGQAGLDGIFQLASFHPLYQFEGTKMEEVSNFTNRSPYPMIHLLREDSLEKVLEFYDNPENIPSTNIQKMKELGLQGILELQQKWQATENSDPAF